MMALTRPVIEAGARVLRVGTRATYFGAIALETVGSTQRYLRRKSASAAEIQAGSISRMCRRLLINHRFSVSVSGTVPAMPCVLIANHLSYLDPLILCSMVPAVPIAKSEVAGWPFIGNWASQLGVLFIRRGDTMHGARVLRQALRHLRAGVSLINFPEGTTTAGNTLLPFYRGVFGLARLARVPVVPAALHVTPADLVWTGGDTFLPHYVRTIARDTNHVRVTFGEPLWHGPHTSDEAVIDEARRFLCHTLRIPR